MSTAKFESAQALFCAIADSVGSKNIDQVLNLSTYSNYQKFKSSKKIVDLLTNQDRIDKSIDYLNVDVSLDEIEKFLIAQPSWYVSSVKIAKALINTLKDVDEDFKSISEPKFLRGSESVFYLRGDAEVMGTIDKLFQEANKNTDWKLLSQTKFGNVNKWSPADIYYAKRSAKSEIRDYLATAKGMDNFDFTNLNDKIRGLIDEGRLLPLSLKKSTSSPSLYPVNFEPEKRDKEIDGESNGNKVDGGLWYIPNDNLWTKYEPLHRESSSPFEPYGKTNSERMRIKSGAPSRDFVLRVADNQNRSNKIGIIQMRHDATSNSWKVDFTYTGGESRGGSIVSHKAFADVLGALDSNAGAKFFSAFEQGQAAYKARLNGKGFKITVGSGKTQTDFTELNANGESLFANRKKLNFDFLSYTKANPGISVFNVKVDPEGVKDDDVQSQNPYTNLRGELSAREVMNRVGPGLKAWLTDKDNTKIPTGMNHSNVDKFIRILFRYVTSQSKKSGQFVIAK